MDDLRRALHEAADAIADYREGLGVARVTPLAGRDDIVTALEQPLPDLPAPLPAVIAELIAAARPGLMASAGPRYYGFVIGGSLDAALIADMLTSGWDQCGVQRRPRHRRRSPSRTSPARGSRSCSHIPASASVGFVTGAQAANTVGLAAGRLQVLGRHGWDVDRDGLFGAPRVRVLAGARAPRHRRPRVAAARARRGGSGRGAGATRRGDGRRGARGRARSGARRADDRLRPGRQRQHGRLRRPAAAIAARRARPGRMAARRRRVRPLGGGQPVAPPTWSTGSSSPTRGAATGTSG